MVACVSTVTDPEALLVTVSVATPPEAGLVLSQFTEPAPEVWTNETVSLLSGPEMMTLPLASAIVT
jgi:hypothetical protein